MTDVESVGGKNASLGEMISQLADVGVRVPGGFATTIALQTVLRIWILMMYARLPLRVPRFGSGSSRRRFSHAC
jgi:hypothetical protein